MNKGRNYLKILIGVACVALVLLVAVVAVILDSKSPDPILGVFQKEPISTEETKDPTEDAVEPTDPTEDQLVPPEELPPSVDIPTEKDPVTGEEKGITFPCEIPGYGLMIEKMAPYSGMFVEDGSNANTQNVAMLLVENNSDFPVEYTQISVTCGQDVLLFDISALPAGEKLVVQEKTGKTISDDEVTAATALVVRQADMEMSEDEVKVTDN